MLPAEISDLKHVTGTVSTVHLPDKPDSDGSQFFICISAQPALDGKYSAFGHVTEGMDIVQAISQKPAAQGGLIDQPVRILKVTLEKKKVEPFLNAPIEQLHRTVTLNTTLGAIKIKMMPEWAPETVRNFLKLTETGWYNGTAFHRVAKGFVVQGGMGNTRVGSQFHPADRWVRPLKSEFHPEIKHVRGIVSMAHGDDPNSGATSFFLVLAPSPHLDGQFSAFGQITEGLEVLDAFEKEELDGETPKRRLEITSAAINPQ
jgi:cyclophilin family peptidyl-prolyl cis-trans isomerase